MPNGTLFYVIGPSGSGKDTLINYVREKTDGMPVLFAHRYITRPADAGGENHVGLTEQEFSLRKARGLFALDWQSHGNCYGIGTEIRTWLASGVNVVMNGSREYLPVASERFPDMRVILVWASPEVLYQRLLDRGRETPEEIAHRIERSRQIAAVDHPRLHSLQNDASPEEAGAKFVDLVSAAVVGPGPDGDSKHRGSQQPAPADEEGRGGRATDDS